MRTAFLFTGQGSQFAGMGRELAGASKAARAVFDEADEVLGEPLSTLCFEGPEDRLALTENTQPATLAVSIAAFRAAGRLPDAAAGHSLGEYSALTAAGALTLADALTLVRERARRMQEAVPVGAGGMVVLRKVDEQEARQIAAEAAGSDVCDVANINAPGQIVLSGSIAAIDRVVERMGERKALKLAVSVPFHSSLLRDAAAGFATALETVSMLDPQFPIYCNVDAAPLTERAAVQDALRRQFAGSVLWQRSIERMLEDGFRRFVEFGPKPTLVRMVTQIAKAREVDGVETAAVTTADELASLGG